jgi:DNA-directed RNA polymerase subunit RPC12/RpoP
MARHEDGLDLVRIFITAEQPGTDELLCEYWELVRKRGVQTLPGLTITKCPNCGGPVDGLDPTRCGYCGTRLADPAVDWVVRKITPQ